MVYAYITSIQQPMLLYAAGGNEKATKLSGINTNKVYFIAYTNILWAISRNGYNCTYDICTAYLWPEL